MGDLHENLMMRTVLNLGERMKSRQQIKVKMEGDTAGVEVDGQDCQRTLELNRVLLETFVYLSDVNLAGPGNIKKIPGGACVDRRNPEQATSVLKTDDLYNLRGQRMNSKALFFYLIGQERWAEYVKKYYVDGDVNNPTRSQKKDLGVSLSFVNPASDVKEEELEKAIFLANGKVSATTLFNSYTEAEIVVELRAANVIFLAHGHPRQVHGPSKFMKAANLWSARQKIMKQVDADFFQNKKIQLQKELEEYKKKKKETLHGKITALLTNVFYCFTNTATATKYENLVVDVSNGVTIEGNTQEMDDEHDHDHGDEYLTTINDAHPTQLQFQQSVQSVSSEFSRMSMDSPRRSQPTQLSQQSTESNVFQPKQESEQSKWGLGASYLHSNFKGL